MSTDPRSLLETSGPYKAGFVTDIESESVPPGLNEDVVRLISEKKSEPEWLLEWRLKAFRHWLTMKEPTWQNVHYPPIDYQAIVYYSAPKPEGRAEEPRRGRPEAARDLREARHPPARAREARRRRRGRGLRQRLGRDDLPGEARARSASSSARSRRRCRTIPELVQEVPRLRRALHRQLLRDAELRGLLRRLLRATSRRACAARWSCRPTSASTPPTPASSSGR